MIKQYRKVIEHEIEINESTLTKLIEHAKQALKERECPLDIETIFEEMYFDGEDEIEVFIDDISYFPREIEMYFSDDVYDFVYNIIYDYVQKYLKGK